MVLKRLARKCGQHGLFENDVKMYGTQTLLAPYIVTSLFENDVKMYGTQTESLRMSFSHCLRMM